MTLPWYQIRYTLHGQPRERINNRHQFITLCRQVTTTTTTRHSNPASSNTSSRCRKVTLYIFAPWYTTLRCQHEYSLLTSTPAAQEASNKDTRTRRRRSRIIQRHQGAAAIQTSQRAQYYSRTRSRDPRGLWSLRRLPPRLSSLRCRRAAVNSHPEMFNGAGSSAGLGLGTTRTNRDCGSRQFRLCAI